MYKTEDFKTHYLYDKVKREYIRTFNSMYEIRCFLKTIWMDETNHNLDYFYYDPIGNSMFKNLSMDFKIHTFDVSRFPITYLHKNCEFYSDINELDRNTTYDQYVIFDKDFKIFDYTEMYYEFVAEKIGYKRTFGLGRTYSGSPITESPKNLNVYRFYHNGHKHRGRGKCSWREIINLSEKVTTSRTPKVVVENIVDEIQTDLGVSVNVTILNKAYNSMRGRRKIFSVGATNSIYWKYGKPASWKNRKKTKQWERSALIGKVDMLSTKNTFKDCLKASVDSEYAYNDYDNIL